MRMLRTAAVAFGLLLTLAQAAAEPGHYLVFSVTAEGRFELQSLTAVELHAVQQGVQAKALGPGRRFDDGRMRVHARSYRAGRLVSADAIDLQGRLRRETVDRAGAVRTLELRDPAPSFVLRLARSIEQLELDAGGAPQRFDLTRLSQEAERLPLASWAREQAIRSRVQTKGLQGSPGNRVDLLLMGDGFTAAETAAFASQAAAVRDDFFAISPYREYAPLVNVSELFTASAQSGADHPPFVQGCSSAGCCNDSEAQADPRAGQFVDTAFDASFCSFQVHRLLTINSAKAFTAAAAVPDWDKILMLVNDPVYGGSGGEIPVTSAEPFAVLILIHEYGHSFTGLADEYSFANPGFPTCSDLAGSSPCEPNVTDQTDPARVKWRHWFSPGLPIPTPVGNAGVGLFEGARYFSTGMYRPVDVQCQMNTPAAESFCPVCSEAYALRLYGGGFGQPSEGIDLIEPGTATPATATPVDYLTGNTQRFSAELVLPLIDGIEVQWLLDGQPVAGADSNRFDFSTLNLEPAKRTLELRVSDHSRFLQAASAGERAVHRRQWTLRIARGVDPERVFYDGFEPRPP